MWLADLYGVRLAGVDGHADPEALEQDLAGVSWAVLLAALWVKMKLGRPRQQQQAVLHIQGPRDGINRVMEGHGEGISLCCNLQMPPMMSPWSSCD